MRKISLFALCGLFLLQTGCASFNRKLKALLGSDAPTVVQTPKEDLVKYSQTSNLPPPVLRKYHRVTRETLEKEALLGERQGSLWVMEGQGAYLFSQNIMRLIGDPLAVTLDGDPKEQLQAKVDVIHDLLQKIEDRQKAMLRGPASENGAPPNPAAAPGAPPAAQAKNEQKPKEETKDNGFNVKNVPTRIVERTSDGNYRVKGDQPFLIKGREYKVIVTGVVRAEDFNDEGITASKLLEPKFDIVSVKRSEGSTM
jgi:flagellar L-ring protein precursor FlgH